MENSVLMAFALLPMVWGAAIAALAVYGKNFGRYLNRGLLAFFSSALALSVVLLIGEFTTRFFVDTTDSFGLSKVTQQWFQRYYHSNSLGLRDDIEYPLLYPRGKTRMTFVGDSFTAGHGIKKVEDRFANILRKKHEEDWEVHVFAMNGLDTDGEMRLLAKAIIKNYQLEWVVLVYCLNDITDLSEERKQVYGRIYSEGQRKTWWSWIHHSYFLDWIFYRVKGMMDPDIRDYYGFVHKAYEGELFEKQKARLQYFSEGIGRRGGRLAVVTFPFLHQLGPNYHYRGIHQKLDEFWKSINVPHLDLLDAFEAYPSKELVVGSFDAHPNEKAHKIAADKIEAFLEQLIRESNAGTSEIR